MSAKILKGIPVSKNIKLFLNKRIHKLLDKNVVPTLAAVLVGNHSASEIYVNSKHKTFIKASEDGYLDFNRTKQMGMSILALSGNEKGINKLHDPQSGFKIFAKHGSYVSKNDTIGEFFCTNLSYLNNGTTIFEKSFDIVPQKPHIFKTIH